MHESRRRRRLDRTNHRREIESRRHDRRDPPRKAIKDAMDELADHEIPGTPRTDVAKLVRQHMSLPVEVEGRTVKDIRIQQGDPQHGAHRSDDHVKRYEVVFPRECPECESDRAVYHYSACHHIAGNHSVTCVACDHVIESEDWG